MSPEQKEILLKLKAAFSGSLYTHGDLYGPDYSEVTSGDLEGFTLEKVLSMIDNFILQDGKL